MNVFYSNSNDYVMIINDEMYIGFKYFDENAMVLDLESGVFVPILNIYTDLAESEIVNQNYVELFLPFLNGEKIINSIQLKDINENIVFLDTDKYNKLVNASTHFSSVSKEYKGQLTLSYN